MILVPADVALKCLIPSVFVMTERSSRWRCSIPSVVSISPYVLLYFMLHPCQFGPLQRPGWEGLSGDPQHGSEFQFSGLQGKISFSTCLSGKSGNWSCEKQEGCVGSCHRSGCDRFLPSHTRREPGSIPCQQSYCLSRAGLPEGGSSEICCSVFSN